MPASSHWRATRSRCAGGRFLWRGRRRGRTGARYHRTLDQQPAARRCRRSEREPSGGGASDVPQHGERVRWTVQGSGHAHRPGTGSEQDHRADGDERRQPTDSHCRGGRLRSAGAECIHGAARGRATEHAGADLVRDPRVQWRRIRTVTPPAWSRSTVCNVSATPPSIRRNRVRNYR